MVTSVHAITNYLRLCRIMFCHQSFSCHDCCCIPKLNSRGLCYCGQAWDTIKRSRCFIQLIGFYGKTVADSIQSKSFLKRCKCSQSAYVLVLLWIERYLKWKGRGLWWWSTESMLQSSSTYIISELCVVLTKFQSLLHEWKSLYLLSESLSEKNVKAGNFFKCTDTSPCLTKYSGRKPFYLSTQLHVCLKVARYHRSIG